MFALPGTFAYAAPELLLGEPCDQQADIYRLIPISQPLQNTFPLPHKHIMSKTGKDSCYGWMAGWQRTELDGCSFGVIMWEVVTHEVPVRGALRAINVPQEGPQQVNLTRCVAVSLFS